MTNKDIKKLVEYFNSLETVPEDLTNLVSRLNKINEINEAQLDLIELQEVNN